MAETEKCPEMVSQGMWDGVAPCGRPVKRDGLCGIHARAKEQREAKADKGREEAAEARMMKDLLTKLAGVAPHMDRHPWTNTLRATFDAEDLAAALSTPSPQPVEKP